MLIVCVEQALVEAKLVGGLLGCPSCRGVLGPWGHARKPVLRCSFGGRLLRPWRARCRGCLGTHVLLPDVALLRRQDEIAVIGAAIEAKVAGQGYRRIASRLGVHADTVRGWLRRFAERAELIRAHFTRCAVALDPELGAVLPAGSGIADALVLTDTEDGDDGATLDGDDHRERPNDRTTKAQTCVREPEPRPCPFRRPSVAAGRPPRAGTLRPTKQGSHNRGRGSAVGEDSPRDQKPGPGGRPWSSPPVTATASSHGLARIPSCDRHALT
ncbi:MAG: hypothetical protein WBP81_00480, partial [Solirubrobacteraceae bacterium]